LLKFCEVEEIQKGNKDGTLHKNGSSRSKYLQEKEIKMVQEFSINELFQMEKTEAGIQTFQVIDQESVENKYVQIKISSF
jgi:hypothetical protein